MKISALLITALVILTGFLLPSQTHAAQAWCDTNWSNRKAITISSANVDSDLTNFPLLITATDTDLFAKANSDALDIFFTEETTCDKLKWEKESYTSATGNIVAWVKVPTVDADANTILYMYYGNSAASDQTDTNNTWNTNYKSVWHLAETPGTASTTDSTSNNNDGEPKNMDSADQVAGQLNGSLDFDGSNDYVEVTDGNLLDFEGASESFTVSTWIKPRDVSNHQGIVYKQDADNDFWRMHLFNNNQIWCSLDAIDFKSDTGVFTINNWYHVACVFNKDGNGQVYINGQVSGTSVALSNEVLNLAVQTMRIGNDFGANFIFDGLIDDIRISDTARSAAWIKFSYHNQKPTAGTITLAAQESDTIQGNNLSPPSIPKGGLQVFVNNGEETASSPKVTLTFRRNSDASKIAVSNDSKVSDTSIERIQDFKPWNICLPARQQHLPSPQDCDSGTYTVYTRFYTEQLLRSEIVSDTIIYEKPQPEENSEGQSQEETAEDKGGQTELQEDISPPPLDELSDEEKIRELRLQFISLLKEYISLLQQKLLLLS